MAPIKSLDELVELIKGRKSMTIAVANAQDPYTIEAVYKGVKEGLVNAKMVGDKERIESLAREKGMDISLFEIIDVKDPMEAGRIARDMVRDGEAQVLMKGLISTDVYMRLILDKEKGLLPKGRILSHIAVMDIPAYPKLLFVSDVAVIPKPDLKQKIAIVNYAIRVAHRFGIEEPKVALIAATEKISDKMEATIDAAIITKMADRKQIKGGIIDGPLALDVAVSRESCQIKGLNSPVGGEADILIFPNIETGNVFFKTVTKFTNASIAAMVFGATAPCILTSRADTEASKFYSIALAAHMAEGE